MPKPPAPKPPLKNTWLAGLNSNFQLVTGVQIFLAVYLNAWLILWGMFVFDTASLRFGVIKSLFKLKEVAYSEPLVLILLALAGGGIGGVIYGMEKLWKYSVKHDFGLQYAGDYIFRHIGSAALGAIIFALVVSGLFNLDQLALSQPGASEQQTAVSSSTPVSTEDSAGTAAENTPESDQSDMGEKNATEQKSPFDSSSGYFAFGIGFLAGFGSYQVTRKLDDIVKVIFGRLKPEDLEN